jgi:hypothetical protein
MSDPISTAPEVIYLCLGDDEEVMCKKFGDLMVVSWCEDPATTYVVRYVKELPSEGPKQ